MPRRWKVASKLNLTIESHPEILLGLRDVDLVVANIIRLLNHILALPENGLEANVVLLFEGEGWKLARASLIVDLSHPSEISSDGLESLRISQLDEFYAIKNFLIYPDLKSLCLSIQSIVVGGSFVPWLLVDQASAESGG